ncbi:MAG TPA: hypothetical protein VFG72_00635 [Marmoricola sp.]|nr:hypothetical protein [Marmoricola sp.]
MSALLVGYARCPPTSKDLTAQRDGLLALGVDADRIHVDHNVLAMVAESDLIRLAPDMTNPKRQHRSPA